MEKSSLLSLEALLNLYVENFKNVSFTDSNFDASEPIYYFISNEGKRIRPLLLLAACNMFEGNLNEALNPAFGIQMFHNSTLVHDDIIDNADIRRGQPSIQKKYGINNAIISGDIMMIYAYEYLSKTNPSYSHIVYNNFNKTASRVLEGQQMDLDFETRIDVGEEEYLQMIEFKTSVLLAESLRIGAILANTSIKNQDLIYNFGLNLGLSFQIKDDWLDAFGAGEKFGKKIGGDIILNKKTILFVKAWELADATTREKISALMNMEDEDRKIAEMLKIYRDLSVDKQIENLMTEYYHQGLDYLDRIEVAEERKQHLSNFAKNIYLRDY